MMEIGPIRSLLHSPPFIDFLRQKLSPGDISPACLALPGSACLALAVIRPFSFSRCSLLGCRLLGGRKACALGWAVPATVASRTDRPCRGATQ